MLCRQLWGTDQHGPGGFLSAVLKRRALRSTCVPCCSPQKSFRRGYLLVHRAQLLFVCVAYRRVSFAMDAGLKEQNLLCQLGSPHKSLVWSQPCVQSKSFSSIPQRGICTPSHTGSTGLYPCKAASGGHGFC